jgi:hypothetical protein
MNRLLAVREARRGVIGPPLGVGGDEGCWRGDAFGVLDATVFAAVVAGSVDGGRCEPGRVPRRPN